MAIRIGIGSGLQVPLLPGDYWRWVDLCEAGGIDSIWHSDQLLGPTLEPIASLAALAARTSRMRFGTNAVVVAFRDPIVLAKQLATIDFLSSGRVLPVFGVGSASDPYWAATGARSADRGKRSSEAIALVRALLEQEHVVFAGSHFRYDGPGMKPRPARPIPLWIGGQSPAAVRRTAEHGDGWLGGFTTPSGAADMVVNIQRALVGTGRTIEADHYGVTLPYHIGAADHPAVRTTIDRLRARLQATGTDLSPEALAIGNPADVAAAFRRYVDAGIAKFVAMPMAVDAGDLLDQTQLLADHILPRIEA